MPKIFITEVNMPVPCSMTLCHNLSKYSIHDLEGREQTGYIVCEDCLKAIVQAGKELFEPELPFVPDDTMKAFDEAVEIFEQVIAGADEEVAEVVIPPAPLPSVLGEADEAKKKKDAERKKKARADAKKKAAAKKV